MRLAEMYPTNWYEEVEEDFRCQYELNGTCIVKREVCKFRSEAPINLRLNKRANGRLSLRWGLSDSSHRNISLGAFGLDNRVIRTVGVEDCSSSILGLAAYSVLGLGVSPVLGNILLWRFWPDRMQSTSYLGVSWYLWCIVSLTSWRSSVDDQEAKGFGRRKTAQQKKKELGMINNSSNCF